MACVLSSQPLAGLPVLARWAAVLAFASFSGIWEARERVIWLKTLLTTTVVLAFAAIWVGASQGFKGTMTGLLPPYYNYTAFAVAAGTVAAASWALHRGGPSKVERVAALMVAALGAACLLLARARGAMIGAAFAGAVWAARRWGARAAWVAIIGAVLAGGAYRGGILPASWRAAIEKRENRYQEARPEIWRRSEEMAAAKPWFGVGPGNFGAAFRLHPVEARGGSARWGIGTTFAHSEPLNAAAETGLAGLALWLVGFGVSLSILLAPFDPEPAREAATVAAAGMAAHLAVDNMLQIPGLAMLFFSALGVAGASRVFSRRWPRAVVGVGLLLALTAWIPRALADVSPARAALLFPAEAEPREDLAYSSMAGGNLDRADALWGEAEERAPYNAVYPWRRAQIAAAKGRWADAEPFVDRAVALEPGFISARVLKAEILLRTGRRIDARRELDLIREQLRSRGNRISGSGYDRAIWDLDQAEYQRVARAAGVRDL